ncbi:MAG: enoyl-CoA hydratase [Alphaproteobacteria bacterium]|nr:enoyl-CoA hydratase [Alphaproteobacteria bacterium]
MQQPVSAAQTLTRQDGGVLTIVNSDPKTRNALSWEAIDGLRAAVLAAGEDDSVRAVVITGAEGFFSSGGNLSGLKARSEADYSTRRGSVDRLHAMIRAIRACPKPVIAAVEGGASGAGVSLALAGDLVVAAKGAYFSVAYVNIGITPDGGSTAFLSASLPRQLVTEMIWFGDRIPVERLHDFGVVNRITEPGGTLAEAQAMADRLAKGPAHAIAAGKRLISSGQTNPVDVQLELEGDGIAQALGGAEAREGIRAFFEKRKPDFTAV